MHSIRQILEGKTAQVVCVTEQTPVLEVIRLMAEHAIGSVLVMRGDALVGIATERDYARKVILKGRSSQDTPVADIMSSPVITVSPGEDIRRCMQIVTEKRIRHLPVVEGGDVVGLISIGDLLKWVIREQEQEIEQLQQYIAG
ncbi:CBS domain-containing protein [uncultured Aquimonas sp.]|jgi:CBS domain-containing protein|uniref:CBS domain-containing protein n=1 Tax=uncultured Aquimonas sp. TaxID=385483 RepID=UPI00086C048F|nr:CBS domain-containing protein [uncultured Aquimonas sp.]ODU43361.1 MAG: histidine kinase [Xanthomonadaceae bacterium SCN 69-123]